MRYERIISYVNSQEWAILESKFHEITDVLAHHAAGHKFTDAEIRARIGDARPSAPSARGTVGVIPLRGVIANRMGTMDESSGGMSTERFSAMFRQALADPSISSIVIDTDSPGGTVAGVPELFAEIYAARGRKRVVAHVNSLAASGAYWLACAAAEVVVTPSGSVGSIGVFGAHEDISRALDKQGIDVTVFRAGRYKAEGLIGPLSPEAKAHRQAQVDQAYGWFTRDVAKGRNVPVSTVTNGYGQGRVVTATDALRMGMVDRIATFDQMLPTLAAGHSRGQLAAASIEAARRERYGLAALEDDDRARRFRVL